MHACVQNTRMHVLYLPSMFICNRKKKCVRKRLRQPYSEDRLRVCHCVLCECVTRVILVWRREGGTVCRGKEETRESECESQIETEKRGSVWRPLTRPHKHRGDRGVCASGPPLLAYPATAFLYLIPRRRRASSNTKRKRRARE